MRFQRLEDVKNSEAENVIRMLNLFNGQLDLDDILYTEIPILDRLRKVKEKLMKQENTK